MFQALKTDLKTNFRLIREISNFRAENLPEIKKISKKSFCIKLSVFFLSRAAKIQPFLIYDSKVMKHVLFPEHFKYPSVSTINPNICISMTLKILTLKIFQKFELIVFLGIKSEANHFPSFPFHKSKLTTRKFNIPFQNHSKSLESLDPYRFGNHNCAQMFFLIRGRCSKTSSNWTLA